MWCGTSWYPISLTRMKKTKFNAWLDAAKDFILSTPYLLWVLLLGTTLVFTFFQTPAQQQISYDYAVGDVAQRDIKAPRDLLVEDREVSEERRSQARDLIRIVYDLDADLLPRIQASIEDAMKIGRALFEPEPARNGEEAIPAGNIPEPLPWSWKPSLCSRKNWASPSAKGRIPSCTNTGLTRTSPEKFRPSWTRFSPTAWLPTRRSCWNKNTRALF
jgi:membrane-associated HD superfamily phosphohydrolase